MRKLSFRFCRGGTLRGPRSRRGGFDSSINNTPLNHRRTPKLQLYLVFLFASFDISLFLFRLVSPTSLGLHSSALLRYIHPASYLPRLFFPCFFSSQQETREERRKAREQKRYGKQVQAEKLKERTLQKKESIKSIEKWRKTRKHNDFADDGKAPEGFEDVKRRKTGAEGGKTVRDRGGGGQHGGGDRTDSRSTPDTQAKREFKNDKFGFGGRKRVSFFFFTVFFVLPPLFLVLFLRPARFFLFSLLCLFFFQEDKL
jgi:hypothetical protein